MKAKHLCPCVTDSPNLLRDTRIEVTLAARPMLITVAQICVDAKIVYSRAERVFVISRTLLTIKLDCCFVTQELFAIENMCGVGL